MFKRSGIILPKQDISLEEPHIYRIGKEEKKSVTEVLSFLSNYKYKNIPRHILDRAAERGKAIHLAIEVFCKTGVKMSLDDSIHKDASKYFGGFLKWFKKEGKKFLLVGNEYSAFSKSLDCAGTIDIIVEPTDDMGFVDIIDVKNTSSPDKKLVSLQLAGYKMLLLQSGVRVRNCWELLLKPTEDYEFILIEPEIDKFYELNEIINWYSKKEED